MDKHSLPISFCNPKSTLATELTVGTPGGTPGSNADNLANALGVSPLYRQLDSARWANAVQVYRSSRTHSPIPSSGALQFEFGEHIKSPFSTEDIAEMNRAQHQEGGGKQVNENAGPLELEAISALHELSSFVDSISVSELLPKTAELIFLNVKTKDDQQFTLELTMKGWRICSSRMDCMYGDYLNVDLHIRYFPNAKQILKVISPSHSDHFADCLTGRLNKLLQARENDEQAYRKSLSANSDSKLNSSFSSCDEILSIPMPESSSMVDELTDETMFL